MDGKNNAPAPNRERSGKKIVQERLQDDLDAGMRFLHLMGMQSKHDLADLTSRLYALIEELVAKGQLDLRSFDERRNRLWDTEQERIKQRAHVQVADNIDKYQIEEVTHVDCISLHEICKARCCKLTFPLSFQDVDERIVQWDYAVPYQVKKREDGFCVHHDRETCRCRVYANRPAICRTYDCRNDERIWSDFENRIPADEKAAISRDEKPHTP